MNLTHQAIADMLGHGSLKMLQEHYAKWIKGALKKRIVFLIYMPITKYLVTLVKIG
jgi:hypothetical protein